MLSHETALDPTYTSVPSQVFTNATSEFAMDASEDDEDDYELEEPSEEDDELDDEDEIEEWGDEEEEE
jgi:hypothetical protein